MFVCVYLYLPDAMFRLGLSRNISFIGIGDDSHAISRLVSLRSLEGIVKCCVLFPTESPGTQVAPGKAHWYFEHSRVFVSSEEPLGSVVPFSKSFGTCVSCGSLESSSSSRCLITCIDYTFFHIKEAMRHDIYLQSAEKTLENTDKDKRQFLPT